MKYFYCSTILVYVVFFMVAIMSLFLYQPFATSVCKDLSDISDLSCSLTQSSQNLAVVPLVFVIGVSSLMKLQQLQAGLYSVYEQKGGILQYASIVTSFTTSKY